jgi:iron(III) transport system permease protein
VTLSRRRWTGIALAALLAWLIAYPLVLTLVGALRSHGMWTLDHVRAFLDRPTETSALLGSLWIAVASVVLAALIGIPLAFFFERYDFPGRRWLGAMVALPAVLPPLVGVVAFIFLFGESGFLAHLVKRVFSLEQAPWRLQGAGAILLVHAYSMYVYFYLFVRAGLAAIDA